MKHQIHLIGKGHLSGMYADGFWKITADGLNQFGGKFLPSEIEQMREDAAKYIFRIAEEMADALEAAALIGNAQTYSEEFEERVTREAQEHREQATRRNQEIRESKKAND